MLRSLRHYWKVQLSVLLAVAVTTAVLTGALLVGDSVRGSLEALALDRLGNVEAALLPGRFFRESLAGELGAPAIVLRGSVVDAATGARASRVAIHGVDERFTVAYGSAAPFDLARASGQPFPSAVLNESLRGELGAGVGDAVLLHFERRSTIPRGTLLGETNPEDVLDSLRVTVTGVIPDRGIGRFGWGPQQEGPKAFVALAEIQRSLAAAGQVNAAFLTQAASAGDRLAARLTCEDFGLVLRRGEGYLEIKSAEYVLRPDLEQAIVEAAAALAAPMLRAGAYVLNGIRHGDRQLPYSMVAALDGLDDQPWARLVLEDGSQATLPASEGILLDRWAADDLDARVGDALDVHYFFVDPTEKLHERTARLVVRGVVDKLFLAADRDLAPEVPGIEGTADIRDWDPPFPVDLSKIRVRDEEYWDRYGMAPKAFVSREAAETMWGTRFGSTTAVRLAPPAGVDLDALEAGLRRELAARVAPESFGFRLQPLREEGLRASSGATDFGGLFVGFSLFLIVSALLLSGLLFRLGVEARAGEIGLLLAVGHPVAAVRRRLIGEAALVATAGALVGLGGAVLYAWALMAGLRTLWRPAVGTSELYLYVPNASLALGLVLSLLTVLVSLAWSVHRLVHVPPARLLAGDLRGPTRVGGGKLARGIALACGILALALSGLQAARGEASPALAFGAGFLALVAGLSTFSLWCRPGRRSSLAPGWSAMLRMAARNSAWNPGRSMLSVALVASACFMIVTVAANREAPGDLSESRESGTGGFSIVAESDSPIYQDLARDEDRFALGFSAEESASLAGVEFVALRRLPGDDASCLNLYRPERPRVLGVPATLVARGGFLFQKNLEVASGASPWSLLERPLEGGSVPAIGDANSVQWILHLGLGRDLPMTDGRGAPLTLRIAGMLHQSIFQSELLISEQNFVERFPDRSGHEYFLIDAPPARAGEVIRLLESRLAAFGFDATLARDKLAAYKAVENTYLSTFQVLGGLGLLLGTLGLGIVLVKNVLDRRGELATLRACGFRQRSLAFLVLAENAFLLGTGMALGTLAALAAVAPRLSTLHPPWGSLAGTLGAVLVVGLLASAGAVVGSLRVPLLGALKAER